LVSGDGSSDLFLYSFPHYDDAKLSGTMIECASRLDSQ